MFSHKALAHEICFSLNQLSAHPERQMILPLRYQEGISMKSTSLFLHFASFFAAMLMTSLPGIVNAGPVCYYQSRAYPQGTIINGRMCINGQWREQR
jgi:hypothetical protein